MEYMFVGALSTLGVGALWCVVSVLLLTIRGGKLTTEDVEYIRKHNRDRSWVIDLAENTLTLTKALCCRKVSYTSFVTCITTCSLSE